MVNLTAERLLSSEEVRWKKTRLIDMLNFAGKPGVVDQG